MLNEIATCSRDTNVVLSMINIDHLDWVYVWIDGWVRGRGVAAVV